jgi:DNA-directed RNA polymerase specialized sigma24 family protein
LRALADPGDQVDQVTDVLELFAAISHLPRRQFDVMVLRRLCGFAPEAVSSLVGTSRATVRSDERHATHYLESILCPPISTEGKTP